MIINLTTDQSEWIQFILNNWKHNSLAERFADSTRVLVTETEVQLILEALEEEKVRVEGNLEDESYLEAEGAAKRKEAREERKHNKWDFEVLSSAIASLESQLKGGKHIEPNESNA